MRDRTIQFFTRTLPPFLWAGFIFYSSSLPDTSLPLPKIIPHADKIVHAGAYGLLCLLIARAINRRGSREMSPWLFWTVSVFLASLFGAFDEWHQHFVPTRTCSVWDWLADAVGTILVVAAWIVWKRVCERNALTGCETSASPSTPDVE